MNSASTLNAIVVALTLPAGNITDGVFGNSFEAADLPFIPSTSAASSQRQTPRPLGSVAGAAQGYYEYLPPGYQTTSAYPLLIFIHGLGENGDGDADLPDVLANGPPRLINNNQWPNARPFVVLSPQHSGGGCTTSGEIDAFINFALNEYSINADRVYLTGLSCGAIGSWNYAGNFINTQVAAIVPIAGNGNGAFNNAGCALGDLPIWAFHGDIDDIVGASGSIQPINNLNNCMPAPVDARLTLYPGVEHNSWRRTYDLSAGHDIYAWMLSYRRPE